MHPIDTVYVVEGIVADRQTQKTIRSAILYNDSMSITTTSDENGYFKIVVPYKIFKNHHSIPIDIVKSGYKRNGSGFNYNPSPVEATNINVDETVIWNYDVKLFWMAKNESELTSTSSANAPIKTGAHGYSAIKMAFENCVTSNLREEKFDRLKEGNSKVYFQLGKETGFATSRYDIIVIGNLTHIYLDGKKVDLSDINKMARRSSFYYDRQTSDLLSKKLGKETLAFTTRATSKSALDEGIKATLEIELDQ